MRNKSIYFLISVFLAITLLLSSCGFRLRGYQTVPPQMHTLYVACDTPYDPFILQLKSTLLSMDVNVVKSAHAAPITLQITAIDFNEALTSISANTQVKTYNLIYQITFQLVSAQGKIIYGPQTIIANAPYVTGDYQLLADSQALQTLKQQMRRDLFTQLFERINSMQGKAALGK
jgi:LPS-assembly lipoprotein